MGLQIDQSGKVEDTSQATVLAASNSTKYTIYIPAKEKRILQEHFRRIGKPRLYTILIFSVLLYFLIDNLKTRSLLEIDLEYTNHTKEIEWILKLMFGENQHIRWSLIGKNSSAHDLGYKTLKKKLEPNIFVTSKEVLKTINRKAGGYLKIGLSPTNRYSSPGFAKIILPKKRKMSR